MKYLYNNELCSKVKFTVAAPFHPQSSFVYICIVHSLVLLAVKAHPDVVLRQAAK